MTFTTFCRLLSQAVIHSRQPVALNWARNSFGLVLTVFLRKICILGIAEYFLIVLFQISEIKKDEIRFKKYIFLLDMFLIAGGEGSSNRNASRDESVEAGDKSVQAGDESIEAGEKTPQSCYNVCPKTRACQGRDHNFKWEWNVQHPHRNSPQNVSALQWWSFALRSRYGQWRHGMDIAVMFCSNANSEYASCMQI